MEMSREITFAADMVSLHLQLPRSLRGERAQPSALMPAGSMGMPPKPPRAEILEGSRNGIPQMISPPAAKQSQGPVSASSNQFASTNPFAGFAPAAVKQAGQTMPVSAIWMAYATFGALLALCSAIRLVAPRQYLTLLTPLLVPALCLHAACVPSAMARGACLMAVVSYSIVCVVPEPQWMELHLGCLSAFLLLDVAASRRGSERWIAALPASSLLLTVVGLFATELQLIAIAAQTAVLLAAGMASAIALARECHASVVLSSSAAVA